MQNEDHPNTFSAGVRPGSPQPASIAGASPPLSTTQSASARRTLSGIRSGTHSGIRIWPAGPLIVAIACASRMAGSDRRPPQLPE
jgi:hypothetical protein